MMMRRAAAHRPSGLRDLLRLGMICMFPPTLVCAIVGYALGDLALGLGFGLFLGVSATLLGWAVSQALWTQVDRERKGTSGRP